MLPNKLLNKLEGSKRENTYRSLEPRGEGIDFASNDYLGFSKDEEIFKHSYEMLKAYSFEWNGSMGSRLIFGNHFLFERLENFICEFHQAESCVIFNSGYSANLGFFSCVPQREDLIFFDEMVHASIREGIRLSFAKSYKLEHNNHLSLKESLEKKKNHKGEKFVVIESVYSMDGDSPDIELYAQICKEYKAKLIIDEAHATGFYGDQGQGLVYALGLQEDIFARIHTFGKALGVHGGCILGCKDLSEYLINYCKSFIYTTALPPHTIASIYSAYRKLASFKENADNELKVLNNNILHFRKFLALKNLLGFIKPKNCPIQIIQLPGKRRAKNVSIALKNKGFELKAIMSPTVPKGKERIRIAIHATHNEDQIEGLLSSLANELLR